MKRRIATAASIWFEIWGVVEPGQKNFDFSRQISLKNFDFSRQISERFRFFGQFKKKIRISRQKLAIYNYFLANYSISLQKSPLRTYFLYMIRYNSIS